MKEECHGVVCRKMKNNERGNLPTREKYERGCSPRRASQYASRVRGQAFMQTRIHKRDRNHRHRRYANETSRDLNLDGTRSSARARLRRRVLAKKKRSKKEGGEAKKIKAKKSSALTRTSTRLGRQQEK